MQFTEVQKFRQWYIWLVIPITAALLMFEFVYTYKTDNTSEFKYCFVFSIIPMLVLFFLWQLRLTYTIDNTGITYRFYPLIKTKHLAWADVTAAYVRKYNPLTEYGGWGLRKGFKSKNYAYNVAGSKGLQLVLKNGDRFLLGTQRADELTVFMEELYRQGIVNKGEQVANIKDRY